MPSIADLPRPVKTYHTQTYDRISPSNAQFKGEGKTVLITGGVTGQSTKPAPAMEPTTNTQSDRPRMIEVLSSVGPIDVLVLSAAASHKHVKSTSIDPAEFDETFTTNILACYDMVRAYISQPSPSNKTVINVSSGAAHVTLPGQVGYGASKAGFLHVLSAMAAEYSPETDGVRLMSMPPGTILTDMARKTGYGEADFPWEDEKLPGDFAVWLAGNEADFLHGRLVWAQWDVEELLGLRKRAEEEPGFLKLGLIF
ncbi:hypothetical protein CLAFUW4_08627 [Fulvia fulva]|uniref:Short chain dehydrogenase citE n=1 Tax=Passalora fulva TaxID=5499 RepID=A0A9Q8LDR0_PASFU|nr:Short chain dehydrogenase citE [Fulvia fulva]KAK4629870.1 hypothetical protein CLAFUR0_08625 [Fulvia fulva]UJO15514.1 Short chain dehydrogenase citE [Fulvia fulva]WPV13082.1 hypothetical protein CLAFUW4_08627 [Fulvia fulva]